MNKIIVITLACWLISAEAYAQLENIELMSVKRLESQGCQAVLEADGRTLKEWICPAALIVKETRWKFLMSELRKLEVRHCTWTVSSNKRSGYTTCQPAFWELGKAKYEAIFHGLPELIQMPADTWIPPTQCITLENSASTCRKELEELKRQTRD